MKNYYSIQPKKEKLFAESPLVFAENSKIALETFTGKKVIRVMRYKDPFDYCVFLSNQKGFTYADKRKRVYYNLKPNLQTKNKTNKQKYGK